MSQSNDLFKQNNRIRIEKIITFTVLSNSKYKCKICAKGFNVVMTYYKHRQMHRTQSRNAKANIVFNCRKCFHDEKPHSALVMFSSNDNTEEETLNQRQRQSQRLKRRQRQRQMQLLPKSYFIQEFSHYDSSTDDSDLEQ